MDIIKKLTEELNIGRHQVEAAVKLIDRGNMISSIARYRKEATDSSDDEVLCNLDERLKYLRNLEDRKSQVIASIMEQEKLTPELELKIKKTQTLVAVEDLYRPYKPKCRTRAMVAKEEGLEPLTDLIGIQMTAEPVEKAAAGFVSEEKGVASVQEAIQGARDILAERISDNVALRIYIRNITMNRGITQSSARDEKAQSVYEMYYNYEEPVKKAAGHHIPVLSWGENEKTLAVKTLAPEEQILGYLEKQTTVGDNPYTTSTLKEAAVDSYSRLTGPSIEREIRNDLTEKTEEDITKAFGRNLEQLLMQLPIVEQVALDWDPAFRTGCKLAVVGSMGKVLDIVIIYPTAPQNKVEESRKILKDFIKKYNISLISVGNDTASRESEQIVVDLLKEIREQVQHVIINEAGASVHLVSKLAIEEFPAFDVGQRSTVSITRRLQDPLSELVKINPKSIDVGQYQHDMNQKRLGEALEGVVEDCVNKVGADLNTASVSLLKYMSGINKTLIRNIAAYREENEAFKSREQLLKVAKLGPKASEQCAGFVRITGGENLLDGTNAHPESYDAAGKLLEKLGYKSRELFGGGLPGISRKIKDYKRTAQDLGIGEITLRDIAGELKKPARDPRDEMPRPILRSDILEVKDLEPGMVLKGTVRNVIDFGASMDIGVHQDSLVHISQMTDKYVKHPLEVVSVGDIVDVKILSVDLAKKRILLTMKGIKQG